MLTNANVKCPALVTIAIANGRANATANVALPMSMDEGPTGSKSITTTDKTRLQCNNLQVNNVPKPMLERKTLP